MQWITVDITLWKRALSLSDIFFEKEVISQQHNKTSGFKLFILAPQSTQILCNIGVCLMTHWVQNVNWFNSFAYMLGYTEWKQWSKTITKRVQCLYLYDSTFLNDSIANVMHVNPGALVQIPLRVIFFQSKIIVTEFTQSVCLVVLH